MSTAQGVLCAICDGLMMSFPLFKEDDMRKLTALLCALSLLCVGCQTIREHPVMSALVAGSIAATIIAHNGGSEAKPPSTLDTHLQPAPSCNANPQSCR